MIQPIFRTHPNIIQNFLNAKGYTSGTVHDNLMAYFGAASGVGGTLSDRVQAYMLSYGLTGECKDNVRQFFVTETGIADPKDAERSWWGNTLNELVKSKFVANVKTLVGSANVKGLWIFDPTTGTVVSDRSGLGHNATLGGDASTLSPSVTGNMPTLTTDTNASHSWTVASNADFSFGGGSPDKAFSVVAFIKPTTLASNQIICKGAAPATSEWNMSTNASKALRLYVASPNESKYLIRTSGGVIDGDVGTFHSYIGTYDGSGVIGGLKVYRDATRVDAVSTDSVTYVGMTNGAGLVANSSNNGSAWSKNTYGVTMVVSKELSQPEVTTLNTLIRTYAGL